MKKRIINILLIVVISILSLIIFYSYKNYISLEMKISLFIIYLLFVFALYFEKNEFINILYFVLLFVILFVRDKVDANINGKNYLLKWFKIIFKNKIVFINIVGNLVLYMPFMIIIHNKNNGYINSFVITCFFIVLFEFLQMFFKRGVFDYNDIILNIIGTLIIAIIYKITEVINNGEIRQGKKEN